MNISRPKISPRASSSRGRGLGRDLPYLSPTSQESLCFSAQNTYRNTLAPQTTGAIRSKMTRRVRENDPLFLVDVKGEWEKNKHSPLPLRAHLTQSRCCCADHPFPVLVMSAYTNDICMTSPFWRERTLWGKNVSRSFCQRPAVTLRQLWSYVVSDELSMKTLRRQSSFTVIKL